MDVFIVSCLNSTLTVVNKVLLTYFHTYVSQPCTLVIRACSDLNGPTSNYQPTAISQHTAYFLWLYVMHEDTIIPTIRNVVFVIKNECYDYR